MKRDIETEEIEAVLEKIWDLHDKLSDAIHSISRTHFFNSTKSLKNSPNSKHLHHQQPNFFDFNNNNNSKNNKINSNGFVYCKDSEKDSAIAEAKSLNSIRCALENLEEQLEFFHTQQRAERDAALARLEQSRVILALRLADHHGKNYKVIDEAMDFVGNVRDASCFVGPENFCNPPASAPVEQSMLQKGVNSNMFVRVLFSAKKTLQLDKLGGVIGNAALFAISMLALLHLQQVTMKNDGFSNIGPNEDRMVKKQSQRHGSSSTRQLSSLDVRLARG